VALIVLDASVLIALLDPADALHGAATAALDEHAAADLKIPASAYSESLVGPARRGQAEAAKQAIASLLVDVVPITDRIAEAAADLRAREARLRLPDALVIATGAALSADRIITGDAAWRRLSRTVTVLSAVG
jgi:predicted nucleic acid-binding protein